MDAGLPLGLLLTGLCCVLDAVHVHVLPRASRALAGSPLLAPCSGAPPAIEIDSAYVIWGDPAIWGAVARLARARGVLRLTFEEEPREIDEDGPGYGDVENPVRFSTPGPFTSAPGAYKHYLHGIARLLEEAPSLASISVTTTVKDGDVSDFDVDARWPASAAEGLATLLLSLRSASPALKEVTLRGFYGRRLAFPAPDGGS